jgi:hypothetical protein
VALPLAKESERVFVAADVAGAVALKAVGAVHAELVAEAAIVGAVARAGWLAVAVYQKSKGFAPAYPETTPHTPVVAFFW